MTKSIIITTGINSKEGWAVGKNSWQVAKQKDVECAGAKYGVISRRATETAGGHTPHTAHALLIILSDFFSYSLLFTLINFDFYCVVCGIYHYTLKKKGFLATHSPPHTCVVCVGSSPLLHSGGYQTAHIECGD